MNVETVPVNLLRWWGRLLVRVGAIGFGLSTLFPLVAGVMPRGRLPGWVGVADVVLAAILVVVMLILITLAGSNIHGRVKQFCYQVYRGAASLLILFLVVYFLMGNRINWDILLIGLAWRAWLFFYTLPAALTVWEMGKGSIRRETVFMRR